MKNKLDVESLPPEEVQKEILKVSILNNKRLKSIDNSLGFIVLIIIAGLLIAIFGIFIK